MTHKPMYCDCCGVDQHPLALAQLRFERAEITLAAHARDGLLNGTTGDTGWQQRAQSLTSLLSQRAAKLARAERDYA